MCPGPDVTGPWLFKAMGQPPFEEWGRQLFWIKCAVTFIEKNKENRLTKRCVEDMRRGSYITWQHFQISYKHILLISFSFSRGLDLFFGYTLHFSSNNTYIILLCVFKFIFIFCWNGKPMQKLLFTFILYFMKYYMSILLRKSNKNNRFIETSLLSV